MDSLRKKAFELDSLDASNLAGTAAYYTWTKFEWDRAEKYFEKSIRINPNNAQSRAWYAHFLMIQNRWDEAWREMEMALNLDPENPWVLAFCAIMYSYDGKMLSAAKTSERLLQIAPDHPLGDQILLSKYIALNNDKEAVEYLIKVVNKYKVANAEKVIRDGFKDGQFNSAIRSLLIYLEKYTEDHPFSAELMARFYGYIGEKKMQEKWLVKMYETKNPNLPYYGIKKFKFDSKVREVIMKEIELW